MPQSVDTKKVAGNSVIGADTVKGNTFISITHHTHHHFYGIAQDLRDIGACVQQSSSNLVLDGSTSQSNPALDALIEHPIPRSDDQAQIEHVEQKGLTSSSLATGDDLVRKTLAGFETLISAFPTLELEEKIRRVRENLYALRSNDEQILEGLRILDNYIQAHLPPTYSLFACSAQVVAEQTLIGKSGHKRINLYGMFLQLLQQQPTLCRSKMISEQQHLKILFLGNSKIQSKQAFRRWVQSSYFKSRQLKAIFNKDQAVIDCWSLERFRLFSCNLEVKFTFANDRDGYREALCSDADYYMVLCFKTSDSENLKRTLNKWYEIEEATRDKHPPKVLLGFAPGDGAARVDHTTVVTSKSSEARSFHKQNSNRQTCSDEGEKVKADIYIECASNNEKAQDMLFTTLIGCAAASHYERLCNILE